MILGSAAERMRPKLVLFNAEVGLLKLAWFSTLNTSQRNCSDRAATLNVRLTARSFCSRDGPTKAFGLSVL